jgi:heat shock protein HtpX
MSEQRKPLLVYNRIDANRRRTRRLLLLFGVALLPFVSGAAVWIGMPLVIILGMFAIGLAPGLATAMDRASLPQAILVEASLFGSGLLLVTLALVVVTLLLIHRYSAALILRGAHAQPVDRKDELDLHRIVESLCIGAGLPPPRLYLIESTTPNAFATGRDPREAAFVVTRGLLTLLNRRELEGVVAHELSHIGHQDIRLHTTLAGLVGTLTLPVTIILAVLRSHPLIAVIAVVIGMQLLSGFVRLEWFALTELPKQVQEATSHEFPPILWWWGLHSLATPFYMIFIAPIVGRLLKRGVSREREFLADADAVALTRNPEALALALVKVGSTRGTPIRVGPATTHIYFMDPVPNDGPWLAGWFRSHPPVEERLDLLLRMGSGIAPSAVQEAIRAGVARRPAGESAHSATPLTLTALLRRFTQQKRHPVLILVATMVVVSLWRGPLGFADMLGLLCAGIAFWYYARRAPSADNRSVTTTATPSRVEQGISSDGTNDSPGGRVKETGTTKTSASSPPGESCGELILLAEEADVGERLVLVEGTMLYSKPDGWSPIVEQLPKGREIMLKALNHGFLEVETDTGSVGYVGRRTRLIPTAD